MSHIALWIDHQKALVFEYSALGISERVLHNQHPEKHDPEHYRQFYREVMNDVKAVSKILIMGPGHARDEFKKQCELHNKVLGRNIVGCQALKDHVSKSEVREAADKFYRKYFNFAGVG